MTGKICPEPYVRDSKSWNEFKARLVEPIKTKENDEMIETINVNINGKSYKVARILKNGKNYVAISDLEQAGFAVGYDKNTKIPRITNKPRELAIIVDDKETVVEAVNIQGNNYVPIRSLTTATGTFDVDYKNGRVVVKTK